MSMPPSSGHETSHKLILRADLEGPLSDPFGAPGATRHAGHTLAVSQHELLVRTDAVAEHGAPVRVTLSFPGLLEPMVLEGTVTEQHVPAEPGEMAGLTLRVAFSSDADRERLEALLERCRRCDRGEEATDEPSLSVLLVEDSDMIRQMFSFGSQRYFKRRAAKVEVHAVPDAAKAWHELADRAFDLVIVDYYLPGSEGSALVERARSSEVLSARVPIVGISVDGATAREAFLAAGADIFLDKPLVLRDLFLTLELLATSGRTA